ncbi:MAG: alternative ribosome rescue aminoacyl-tRNA hydrolase ArfB [Planctomycetota bacterium]
MLNVNENIKIPLTEFRLTYSRSPGPGGQNVNKVNTKVSLKWNVEGSPCLPVGVKKRFLSAYKNRISRDGVLTLTSHRFRDQKRNVNDVFDKLRMLIRVVAEPPKPRKKKKISAAAKRRRLDHKKRHGEKKLLRKSIRLP